jgi:hypothetical protein
MKTDYTQPPDRPDFQAAKVALRRLAKVIEDAETPEDFVRRLSADRDAPWFSNDLLQMICNIGTLAETLCECADGVLEDMGLDWSDAP